MSRLAIGVDGGGTRARVVVLDERGRELHRGEGLGAVVTAAEPQVAAAAVREAVERALADSAGAPAGSVLWAGLSGAGLPEARAAAEGALIDLRIADRVVVGTDAEAAFHDAFGAGPGILLIAGTGSVALARAPDGSAVRAGGWGSYLGDEGSGFRIGLDALHAVVRADDGRDPPTVLREAVLEALGLERARPLVGWIASASKAEVAALVPLVVRAAADGDEAARSILARAVDELVSHVGTVHRRAGPWPEPPDLALSGGLIFTRGPLRGPLVEALDGIALRLLDRDLDPPRGAARIALRMLSGEAPTPIVPA